jgi:SPP1 family phage portal protein
MQTFGRETIYVPYTEEEILNADLETQKKIVIDIIESSKTIHEKNKRESIYLKDYIKGIQDIYYDKVKHTRPEIDNKTVENWAWATVDFKKCYLLSKAIQYVQLNDSGEEEIALLNKYVRYENKKAKDMLIYDDVLTCGRGFRFKNYTPVSEEDEAPFELINCEPENTEVVYSSKLGKKQLGSYIQTSMEYIDVSTDPITGETKYVPRPYNEYTFYLKNRYFVLNDKSGALEVIDNKPIVLNEHVITEYYTNKYRLSLIEIGKPLLNDINYLESLDKDDMEQFVNAIMVFTNAEVTESEIQAIKQLGAVCISSTDNKKASIELLQQRLNASDTQVYYTRLLTSLHQILGVPMASDNGTLSSGDTGRAKLTGQGYTTAGIRAEGDEIMFGMCDMEALKGILKACKLSPKGIKNLKISDIEPKFFRDMSENLLTKTQALLNLYNCDIPRKFANSIVGLFGDSNAITTEQDRLFGEQISQLNKGASTQNSDNNSNTTNDDDKASEQNNNLTQLQEMDNQEQ